MSVRTTAEALLKCAVTSRWEVGMCGQFCAAMYGYGFSGYGDAFIQWQKIPGALKFPGRTDAPPGALVFWSGGSRGHGHVAIAVGDGTCFSIDIGGPGTVTRVPTDTISRRWGMPYLGWSVPYFQGSQWSPVSIYGTDVSMYQPINFALTLPGSGHRIDFAIIKVTEGAGWTSTRWSGQRQWARDHGMVTGFYHFARPGNMMTQADRFLNLVKPEPGDVLAFDWEDAGVTSAQKDAWLKYVKQKAPGNKVILYCNTSFWKSRDTSGYSGDGLWIATGGIPAGQPPISSTWLIHQYSTAGNYDHDLAQFASRADMLDWAGGDMALSADDKKWISSEVAKQVKAVLVSDAWQQTVNKDAVRSPDDAPTNPTWALGSYARESYLRLLEIKAQAQTNGSGLTAANAKLDVVAQTLAALDLSQLPAEISAKLQALHFTITEG